jgi:hypothetical protein
MEWSIGFHSLLAVCSATLYATQPKSDRKPNIIFILTDDQRMDALGYAGKPIIKTPTLDNFFS